MFGDMLERMDPTFKAEVEGLLQQAECVKDIWPQSALPDAPVLLRDAEMLVLLLQTDESSDSEFQNRHQNSVVHVVI